MSRWRLLLLRVEFVPAGGAYLLDHADTDSDALLCLATEVVARAVLCGSSARIHMCALRVVTLWCGGKVGVRCAANIGGERRSTLSGARLLRDRCGSHTQRCV